jgi:hypothetical protein
MQVLTTAPEDRARAPSGMQVLTTAPARFATGMLENAMIEFDVNESYPMVLSLWHEELRKDVIVRTAALDYHGLPLITIDYH